MCMQIPFPIWTSTYVLSFSSIPNAVLFLQLIFVLLLSPVCSYQHGFIIYFINVLFNCILNHFYLFLDRKLLVLIIEYEITRFIQPSTEFGDEVHLQLSFIFFTFIHYFMFSYTWFHI